MKTKNLAVGALAAVLVLALWYNFLLKPVNAQKSTVKADTATQKSNLQPLQAQLAQANADASHAGTFKAKLAVLQTAVPDSPALANFIRDANAISVASGVAWQSVTHGPPTLSSGSVWSIAVGINVKGTYPQVMDYLSRIAALRRLLVIDTVNFTAAATTGTGAGATTGGGASTGPFSGASQLTMSISGRMFETPPVVQTPTGPEVGVATTPAASTTPAPVTSQPSTLNNS